MDFGAIAAAGWPAAIVAACALAYALLRAAGRAAERRRREEQERSAAYARAYAAYAEAMERGDASAIAEARARLDAMRKSGWRLLALAMALACCGCLSRRPAVALVPVGEHIQFPAPGDTVPALPAGETRWILLSAPTGARLALPDGSPLQEKAR